MYVIAKTRVRAVYAVCAISLFTFSQIAAAKTLCVNPSGKHGCYTTIADALNHAAPNDTIQVGAGTYNEEIDIAFPVSIIGAGAHHTIVDATNVAHGFFVDGYDHPGLNDVTISGFTVRYALYEGVLVVSASDVTLRGNIVENNDQIPGIQFDPNVHAGCPNQPGNGTYETDETGDCGGGIHLVGTANSIVSGNYVVGNTDGILISDETAESHDNLVTRNIFKDNPRECGIVMASHPPAGSLAPAFAPHYGVDRNTISNNVSDRNGVQAGGAGSGLFSDGAGQGRVSGNVIIGNTLTNNGLGGVALHTHVGPAFGLPADDMSNNKIVGNYIAGNLADGDDTATPGRVGININSGGGGSPVIGTVISENTIRDEDIDVAVNTPAEVDVHLNNLLGHKIGVGDVCSFDGASMCTGTVDATQNYWGCAFGPGSPGCSTVSGADVRFVPWLTTPIDSRANDKHENDKHE
ncbi:MAG TPA: right-handed parallel beta-helix repeat-containing protein [Candidatus Sulfotelmatobacter sp.]|nr:right-handed parallel beta-helix repeat-containing protein [Candidatus Sulfotelmatobacter sp.]